jgi:hypothetical protein
MHSIVSVAVFYVMALGSAAFAYVHGERGDRVGALWYSVNVIVSGIFNLVGLSSPTAHLISDGIFATGLLPLAVIYASYWVGALTLIGAGLFALEAVYLIDERAIDLAYATANNALCIAVPIVLMISGGCNLWRSWRARQRKPLDDSALVGQALG